MTASLLSVESPTHKIKTEINLNGDPKTCRVGLAEDKTRLEKDFVLVVKSKDLDKSRYGSRKGQGVIKLGDGCAENTTNIHRIHISIFFLQSVHRIQSKDQDKLYHVDSCPTFELKPVQTEMIFVVDR